VARLYFCELTLGQALGHDNGHTETEFGQRIVNSGFMLALSLASPVAILWGGLLR
jgi:hypothetical protein